MEEGAVVVCFFGDFVWMALCVAVGGLSGGLESVIVVVVVVVAAVGVVGI